MIKPIFGATVSLLIALSTPALAADEMTIEFSFRGARGCSTLFPNPEIKLKNIPVGAKSVLIRLRRGDYEMGGQEILLPTNGVLAHDMVRTWGPCNAGEYTYQATVKSASGQALARAEHSQFFPQLQ